MFGWFMSIMFFFGYHGPASEARDVGSGNLSGARVAPSNAHTQAPNPADPTKVDGGGGP